MEQSSPMNEYSAAIYDAEQRLQRNTLRYGAAAAEAIFNSELDQAPREAHRHSNNGAIFGTTITGLVIVLCFVVSIAL